jgi:hypothetical protein
VIITKNLGKVYESGEQSHVIIKGVDLQINKVLWLSSG